MKGESAFSDCPHDTPTHVLCYVSEHSVSRIGARLKEADVNARLQESPADYRMVPRSLLAAMDGHREALRELHAEIAALPAPRVITRLELMPELEAVGT